MVSIVGWLKLANSFCGVMIMWSGQELAHEEVVRSVKLEQAKEVTKLRQEVEQGAKELASKYERKMKVRLGCLSLLYKILQHIYINIYTYTII